MSTRNVPVADTRFLLREHGAGDGTPVLLLHGVPETSSVLARHRSRAGRRAPRARSGPARPRRLRVQRSVRRRLASSRSSWRCSTPSSPGSASTSSATTGAASIALGLAGAHPERVRSLAVANAPLPARQPAAGVRTSRSSPLPLAPEAAVPLGGKRVVDDDASATAGRPRTSARPRGAGGVHRRLHRPGHVSAMLGYYRAAARPRVAAALQRTKSGWAAAGRAPSGCWSSGVPRTRCCRSRVGESIVKDLGAACSMVTVPGCRALRVEEAHRQSSSRRAGLPGTNLRGRRPPRRPRRRGAASARGPPRSRARPLTRPDAGRRAGPGLGLPAPAGSHGRLRHRPRGAAGPCVLRAARHRSRRSTCRWYTGVHPYGYSLLAPWVMALIGVAARRARSLPSPAAVLLARLLRDTARPMAGGARRGCLPRRRRRQRPHHLRPRRRRRAGGSVLLAAPAPRRAARCPDRPAQPGRRCLPRLRRRGPRAAPPTGGWTARVCASRARRAAGGAVPGRWRPAVLDAASAVPAVLVAGWPRAP